MNSTDFVPSHTIRTWFSQAMSEMYRSEVPSYGELVALVEKVNAGYLEMNPSLKTSMGKRGELSRLNLERHGAIRVGSADELSFLRRIFAILGMYPVGYYDLSVAGVPVHSTAFRPIDFESLRHNPFRLFTSLIRLDLISNPELRQTAEKLVGQRDIFTSRSRELVADAERSGGLDEAEAREFSREIVETFRWHQQATVDFKTYNALQKEHPLIADVVCFKGPHINHLTPRTLDIDRVQNEMNSINVQPKDRVEGPPLRKHPILLRQTSYKAIDESTIFTDGYHGSHTARFGEIEARGMALTPKGRALYDELLGNALARAENDGQEAYQSTLKIVFSEFPDDIETVRREGLAYFSYQWVASEKKRQKRNYAETLEDLIKAGKIETIPITYEDFLPVSAAGIFRSNLEHDGDQKYTVSSNQNAFEDALGAVIHDEFSLYAEMENASKNALWSDE